MPLWTLCGQWRNLETCLASDVQPPCQDEGQRGARAGHGCAEGTTRPVGVLIPASFPCPSLALPGHHEFSVPLWGQEQSTVHCHGHWVRWLCTSVWGCRGQVTVPTIFGSVFMDVPGKDGVGETRGPVTPSWPSTSHVTWFVSRRGTGSHFPLHCLSAERVVITTPFPALPAPPSWYLMGDKRLGGLRWRALEHTAKQHRSDLAWAPSKWGRGLFGRVVYSNSLCTCLFGLRVCTLNHVPHASGSF